jgi:hypothetical protein
MVLLGHDFAVSGVADLSVAWESHAAGLLVSRVLLVFSCIQCWSVC